MLRVALTGNLGAGKSTVAERFARWGARVVDADDVARELVRPGGAALADVAAAFGPEVVGADGGLDRAAMRRLVAADPEARRRLEAILHPRIAERLREEARRAQAEGAPVFVAVVPLLFEAGLEREFDAVVLVDAPEEVRIARVVAAGRMTEPEARALAAAQAPAASKAARADAVIRNDGDLTELEARARAVWDRLAARQPGGRP